MNTDDPAFKAMAQEAQEVVVKAAAARVLMLTGSKLLLEAFRATPLREPLVNFALDQERVLKIHDPQKGGRPGWMKLSPQMLMAYLRDEVRELELALATGDAKQIRHEAVDVANFCMMIHDVAGNPPADTETE